MRIRPLPGDETQFANVPEVETGTLDIKRLPKKLPQETLRNFDDLSHVQTSPYRVLSKVV
jgi:hypothetical protein